jgi:hypothetical protein
VLEGKRPKLIEVAPHVPQDFCDVIERLLCVETEGRFASALALLDALEAIEPAGGHRYRLHVIGDGPLLPAFATAADARVRAGEVVLHGFQPAPGALMRQLRALVFTSDHDHERCSTSALSVRSASRPGPCAPDPSHGSPSAPRVRHVGSGTFSSVYAGTDAIGVRVAEEMAMLDVISGGRLVAGFPVGTPMDTVWCFGANPVTLREKYREGVELIVRAWNERRPFAFNGADNGSISHIVMLDERIMVRRFNDASHLTADLHAAQSQMT